MPAEEQYTLQRRRSGAMRAQSRRETMSPQWSREVLPQENYAQQMQQRQQRTWSQQSQPDAAVVPATHTGRSDWGAGSPQDPQTALRASGRAMSRPL